MTSTSRAFVWVWLPGQTAPVPAGAVELQGDTYRFRYGQRYLENPDAISLFETTMPLQEGWIEPPPGASLALNLRDATPDAWGRRIINDRILGREGVDANLSEIDYMLHSDSNRIGALDFQSSPSKYVARGKDSTIDELHHAATILDEGQPLTPALRAALQSGTGVGGARPKALIDDRGVARIAKFSSSTDILPEVQAEAASLFLAGKSGLNVPRSEVIESLGRKVLLIDRFDRPGDGTRRLMVSGLTMTRDFESFMSRGSYLEILGALSQYSDGDAYGPEIFDRVAFNIAITNTDDHLRNHAAFWDGKTLELTPVYDLAPGSRSGDTAHLVTKYSSAGNTEANFQTLISASHEYDLSFPQGRERVERIRATINDHWAEAADHAHLTRTERDQLWGTQFLHRSTEFGLSTPIPTGLENPVVPKDSMCIVCGRRLTSPESIARGFGLACGKKAGLI